MAIKSLKVGKRQGPDDFSTKFYKLLSPILTPRLFKMYNEVKQFLSLAMDFLRAHIMMVPKPHKDLHQWSKFRPISLLNFDLKILTKILASRLNVRLASLVHSDQTGFVPHRLVGDNIRKVIHLLHLAGRCGHEMFLLSLDIAKAFDTLSWEYLFCILHKWGFQTGFLNWLSVLYSTPTALVQYGGYTSSWFPIQRGTRQGCPMPPLLFVLALEPLA